jgi:hypothetical protein
MGKLLLVVFPRMNYYDNICRWYIWYELIRIYKYCVLKREVIDENTISKDEYANMKINIARKGKWSLIPTNLQQKIKNTQLFKLQNNISFPFFLYWNSLWTKCIDFDIISSFARLPKKNGLVIPFHQKNCNFHNHGPLCQKHQICVWPTIIYECNKYSQWPCHLQPTKEHTSIGIHIFHM